MGLTQGGTRTALTHSGMGGRGMSGAVAEEVGAKESAPEDRRDEFPPSVSALRQGWDEVGAGVFNVVSFAQTWRAISERPERTVEPHDGALRVSPLTFAVQGALLLYLISSSVGGFADAFLDIGFGDRPIYARRMSELDAALAAAGTPEARARARRALRDYRGEVKGAEIAESAAKAATAPAYLAGACVFEWFLRRLRARGARLRRVPVRNNAARLPAVRTVIGGSLTSDDLGEDSTGG
ncbi:MAG: hypothetical protein H8F28_00170 [Fibrella sp.]|nr:hypothetical protein [Armatimonadota bacterium]